MGEELVSVRYKFKDEKNFVTITVTEQQYINLLELPIIEKCEIIGAAVKPAAKNEKEKFNKKIKVAYKNQSRSKYLLE